VPYGQTTAQAPQLRELVEVSMQAPLQRVWPVGQLEAHAPVEQTCPGWHGVAQAPQLLGLLVRSTQLLPQRVSPL
jgi:hypothetical protein